MTVEVDGLQIEVARCDGDASKAPIVLLHEGLGSVSAWGDFPAALNAATSRTVLAYSRGGYGGSTVVETPFDPGYMHAEAEFLRRFLRALELERVVLFGHSDGASIALIFAARYSPELEALVVEAPHVFVEPLTIESIAAIAARYPGDDRLRGGLGRHHVASDIVFRRWSDVWLNPAFRDWDITAELGTIAAPTLVFQGKDDEYGTPAQLEAITAAMPQAQTVLLDRCGHAPHRDAREAVLAATARFLGDAGEAREKKRRP